MNGRSHGTHANEAIHSNSFEDTHSDSFVDEDRTRLNGRGTNGTHGNYATKSNSMDSRSDISNSSQSSPLQTSSPMSSFNEQTCYDEPIAIVGMGCRLPGDATSPSKLWDLLINGKSGHGEMPKSRFNAQGFYHPDASHPVSVNSTGGYFLEDDVRSFDNAFFGINNLEATYMDPQQRQLLEVCFECFESAGVTLEQLSGADVGCYVANFLADFVVLQSKDPELFHRYSATGMGLTILANRISNAFNLKGPSFVLDTACSSSLYALHTACSALRTGDCSAAVVAGANLVQTPELHLTMVKAGFLSPTSQCHTFDSSADGYGRGEGVGALYLKRLSDAIRDGDPIRSVIRGTSVNSNGHTNGLTLPSVAGQEAVIRKAYAMAGLPTDETDYIEAHGTGTSIGDPIEVEALSRVFQHRSGRPTLIGSVKTNLGHSEAVSGITSIVKVTLALENGIIPPTIGIKEFNPKLKLSERNVEVVTKNTKWPAGNVARASVNSFGYGGANAHAILEAAVAHVPEGYQKQQSKVGTGRNFILLPFSGHDNRALLDRTSKLKLPLDRAFVNDLAFTLTSRRSALPCRGYFLLENQKLLYDISPNVIKTLTSEPSRLPIALVFTGQGAQWPRMGYELLSAFPVFRQTIEKLDDYLARLPQPPAWSILSTLSADSNDSQISKASHSQTVCTALQIALVVILKDWNIVPEAVIGHSSGEISAAFAAGYLTATEAIAIAYYRGLVVTRLPPTGAMAAVGLSSEQCEHEITALNLQRQLRVACINSPKSSTISGDSDAIDQLVSTLTGREIFARRLKTDNKAYHSHHMLSVGSEYEALVSSVYAKRKARNIDISTTQMFSSVTGRLGARKLIDNPAYWRRNLESPVLFSDSMQALLLENAYHLIEVGPHSTLQQPIVQIQEGFESEKSPSLYSSTLSRGKDAESSLLNLCGTLFLNQHPINLNRANGIVHTTKGSRTSIQRNRVLHGLPTYSWNHQTILWNESRSSALFRGREHARHDLLGSRVSDAAPQNLQWRNLLKVEDVPWLADHKLGSTMVFPGAGYLALAAEALREVVKSSDSPFLGVRFKQVHIQNVLVLEEEKHGMELFTELRPFQMSGVSFSGNWWQFEITSLAADMTTIHASGLVAVLGEAPTSSTRLDFSTETMEEQATRTWYDKFTKEGLRFGPMFRSMTKIYNDRSKKLYRTVSETQLLCGGRSEHGTQSEYMIHPITLDALLQTAIIASASGSVPRLRGKVPVTIGTAEISAAAFKDVGQCCTIFADSETVGFGTININAELRNPTGHVLATVGDVRAVAYNESGLQVDDKEERNPVLRTLWKLDISTLDSAHLPQFTDYLNRFSDQLDGALRNSDFGRFAGAVDLLTHSNPRLRILEIGDGDVQHSATLLDLLHVGTSLKRFHSYTRLNRLRNDRGKMMGTEIRDPAQLLANDNVKIKDDALFDLVLLPPSLEATSSLLTPDILKALSSHASILSSNKPTDNTLLNESRFSLISTATDPTRRTITIARSKEELGQSNKKIDSCVLIVERNTSYPINHHLHCALEEYFGRQVKRISLASVTHDKIPYGSIVISTIELEDPVLELAVADDIERIKVVTDNASILVWVTGGGLFEAAKPSFSLVGGLARSLMLEQPSLKMYTVDLDTMDADFTSSSQNIVNVLRQAVFSSRPEFEYLQHKGALYSSRFVPEESMNKRFRRGQNGETRSTKLKDAGNCQLNIGSAGQLDSLRFDQRAPSDPLLQPGFVEVQVKVVGMNAKDFYAFHGKVDTKLSTCSCEFSGTVTRVASRGSKFQVGDRVVVMAPTHFATFETVPEWACCLLRDEEDFTICATIPLVFSTALYALEQRAQLQEGETILIHSAAGGLGLAAIQIAQMRGAEIFATVGTQEKKDFLIKTFGLLEDHIFSSRDSSFLPSILKATSERGVDVVLNSLTGDLLHDSWSACAEFGRFIEVGKKDIVDGGKLDMSVFERGVTFTAFDLSNLFWSKNKRQHIQWTALLNKSMELYRTGKITAIEPLKTFDVSDVVQAFRYFGLSTRLGKAAVSFENPASEIQFVPPKFRTAFNSKKAYVLIGCLGGLGRSLSKWMFQRGARRFVFMGRSGVDRAPARALVEDLKKMGANILVVRGDVSNAEDVENGFAQIKDPIGGVIQAAMGLSLALFTEMTSKVWHGGIDQKVKGTWNIHNSLAGRSTSLDFFLCTSSISGSIGVATESNYCAANGFLDAFCRHRRSLGLPATSLGLGMISEVGFLHENPEIEALLLRKGVHPINEDELLQLVDIALSPEEVDTSVRNSGNFPADYLAEGHILTGLELLGLQKIRAMGWERPTAVLDDPRTGIIAGAYAAAAASSSDDLHGDESSLPSSVSSALASHSAIPTSPDEAIIPDPPLILAVQDVVSAKIGALLLVGIEDLSPERQLADFGMDSMLAAEFRGAVFRVFKIDVPFATLLDKRTSVSSLATLVAGKLLKASTL